MLTVTPVSVYAPTEGNIDTVSTTDNDDTDTTDTTDNDDTDTTDTTDNYNDILPFLIEVIECFTNNDEEFSDDVQLCLYDVIELYFDDNRIVIDNNPNSNNANNNLSSNDDNDNSGTSLQDT
jgi:hypothetical protein